MHDDNEQRRRAQKATKEKMRCLTVPELTPINRDTQNACDATGRKRLHDVGMTMMAMRQGTRQQKSKQPKGKRDHKKRKAK